MDLLRNMLGECGLELFAPRHSLLAGWYEHGDEISDSTKGRKFLNWV